MLRVMNRQTSERRLKALRALAARPGTPAEGEVARRKLAELEAKQPQSATNRYGRSVVSSVMFSATFNGTWTAEEDDQTIDDLLNQIFQEWAGRDAEPYPTKQSKPKS